MVQGLVFAVMQVSVVFSFSSFLPFTHYLEMKIAVSFTLPPAPLSLLHARVPHTSPAPLFVRPSLSPFLLLFSRIHPFSNPPSFPPFLQTNVSHEATPSFPLDRCWSSHCVGYRLINARKVVSRSACKFLKVSSTA